MIHNINDSSAQILAIRPDSYDRGLTLFVFRFFRKWSKYLSGIIFVYFNQTRSAYVYSWIFNIHNFPSFFFHFLYLSEPPLLNCSIHILFFQSRNEDMIITRILLLRSMHFIYRERWKLYQVQKGNIYSKYCKLCDRLKDCTIFPI